MAPWRGPERDHVQVLASDGDLGRKASLCKLCKRVWSGVAPPCIMARFLKVTGRVAQCEAEGSKLRPALEVLSKLEGQSQGRTEQDG